MINKICEIEVIYKNKTPKKERTTVKKSSDIYRYLLNVFKEDKIEYIEEVYVILLNNANEILGTTKISSGGINQSIVDVRLIFQAALKANASAIILAHNHPSGSLAISSQDLQLTMKVKEGCRFLDIKLLDHLIVTKDGYYSFADNGNI